MTTATIVSVIFMAFLIALGAVPFVALVQMAKDNKKKYGTYSLPKPKLNKRDENNK